MRLEVAVIAAGAAVAALVGGWLYIDRLKDQRDEARAAAELATDNAAARTLEVEGEQQTAQRVEVVVRQVRAAEQVTTSLAIAANEAIDADELLPADRADRLRAHDAELCRIAASLCAAASTVDAGAGVNPVRAIPPPAEPETG